MTKEEKQKILEEAKGNSRIFVAGDCVEKKFVEYEIGNVDAVIVAQAPKLAPSFAGSLAVSGGDLSFTYANGAFTLNNFKDFLYFIYKF